MSDPSEDSFSSRSPSNSSTTSTVSSSNLSLDQSDHDEDAHSVEEFANGPSGSAFGSTVVDPIAPKRSRGELSDPLEDPGLSRKRSASLDRNPPQQALPAEDEVNTQQEDNDLITDASVDNGEQRRAEDVPSCSRSGDIQMHTRDLEQYASDAPFLTWMYQTYCQWTTGWALRGGVELPRSSKEAVDTSLRSQLLEKLAVYPERSRKMYREYHQGKIQMEIMRRRVGTAEPTNGINNSENALIAHLRGLISFGSWATGRPANVTVAERIQNSDLVMAISNYDETMGSCEILCEVYLEPANNRNGNNNVVHEGASYYIAHAPIQPTDAGFNARRHYLPIEELIASSYDHVPLQFRPTANGFPSSHFMQGPSPLSHSTGKVPPPNLQKLEDPYNMARHSKQHVHSHIGAVDNRNQPSAYDLRVFMDPRAWEELDRSVRERQIRWSLERNRS